MHLDLAANPALTVALALAAGMLAQALARHLRIPGIVFLLAAGALLGSDLLGLVQPRSLGGALETLTGFAVAVILFEGGLNLHWRRLREQARPIRLLLSVGVVVTALGGALAARLLLGWDLRLAVLFGTLVIVTGPTVITPLLRRIKVSRRLETILEAEGVLIDAVGAVVAIVALEVVLAAAGGGRALPGVAGLPARLLVGALTGAAGGVLMALLLRWRRLVPADLENVLVLSLVLALYQLSDAILSETGIVSAIVAGMVLGNSPTRVTRELREFKEQLTVLAIGMLFVLLAADVRLRELLDLGRPGLLVALALVLVVRPLNILACTGKSGLNWREKTFLAWVAPRGIVAAALASLFNERLTHAGIAGGEQLRAMVFLVIGVTVLVQGATAAPLARRLGLRRPSNQGYAILGAQPLPRLLARLLRSAGEDVVLIDASDACCASARDELPVIFGNALEERALLAARVESRRAVIGALPNGAVNLLFAKKAMEEHDAPDALVALPPGGGPDPKDVAALGGGVLFAEPRDLELWSVRLRRGIAVLEAWRREAPPENGEAHPLHLQREVRNSLLPLALRANGRLRPVCDRHRPRADEECLWLLLDERAEEARAWLAHGGWRPGGDAGVSLEDLG